MIDVELTVIASIPREQVVAARRCIATLDRFARRPLIGARLTLRRDGRPRTQDSYVADGDVLFDGRVLVAHAAAPTAVEAAAAVAERLRRQLRDRVGAGVALRNDPRAIRAAEPLPIRLKPPERREIVHRRTFAEEPEATLQAVVDMLEDAEDFHLFHHVRTGEDVVVHWCDDRRRIGLLFPPGSVLADEGDLLAVRPSWYSSPLPFATARAEMDVANYRFLYFIDAADDRGRVIYLRADGDYGVVEPAP
jgi:sigma 54 modulation/S30EA-like ribosomal protein